jgi:hypothetical protein
MWTVEGVGVLGLGEREHRPLQWPRVSLLTRATLQIRIRFVRQRTNPTLEQTMYHKKVKTEYSQAFQLFQPIYFIIKQIFL